MPIISVEIIKIIHKRETHTKKKIKKNKGVTQTIVKGLELNELTVRLR